MRSGARSDSLFRYIPHMAEITVLRRAVSQSVLDEIVAIDCQIARLSRLRSEHGQSLLNALLDGATVEPGRHTADIQSRNSRTGRLFQLTIDGRRIA